MIINSFPEFTHNYIFEDDKSRMDKFISIVTAVRSLRNQAQIAPKEEVRVSFYTDQENFAKYLYQGRGYLKEMAKVVSGNIFDKTQERPSKSILYATSHTEVFLSLDGMIDVDAYKDRLKNDLKKTQAEFEKVQKKLKNPNFVKNAPDDVVEEVKGKASNFQEKLDSLNSTLSSFS